MTKEWIKKYYNEVVPYYRNIGSNPELKAINREKPLSFFVLNGETFIRHKPMTAYCL